MILTKLECTPCSTTSASGALLGLKKTGVCNVHSAWLCAHVSAFQTKHTHIGNILGRVLTSMLFLKCIMNW